MSIKRPRGTNDILPDVSADWYWLEEEIRKLCRMFNYQEIRTPIFEYTELFQRGVGQTTDIVQKEMYTFMDRGNRSITLRPEGTAAVVRAYLENKLYNQQLPIKLFYIGPMFRYDRPQTGRYRQFHQFGVEVIGSAHPAVDAEVIYTAMEFYKRLGLKDITLLVNSVGCPACRPIHKKSVSEYLQPHYEQLCETCQDRYEKNPLRIMDCKNPKCQELVADAPSIINSLCEECSSHFKEVLNYLKIINIEYKIDERLVRGLDYYTKTAFEITVDDLGAQNAIGGGGRYDYLISECDGPDTPAIGFALGMERILLTLKNQGKKIVVDNYPMVYAVGLGKQAEPVVFELVQKLRSKGISTEMDLMGRSLKAQMKFADKLGAKYTIIIGQEELEKNMLLVKNMQTGEQKLIDLDKTVNYLLEQQGGNNNGK